MHANRHIFRHPSSATRLQVAKEWLLALPKSEEIVVVGPTHEAGQELLRQVAMEQGAGFGWHRVTVTRLASELAGSSLVGQGIAPIGELGCEAIVARVVHDMLEQNELGRYSEIAHCPGFAGAISRALFDASSAEVPRKRLELVCSELRVLGERYDQVLQDADLVDRAGLLQLAIRAVEDGCQHHLLGRPTLLLDLPLNTRRTTQFIQRVVERAVPVLATCPSGDAKSQQNLAHALQTEIYEPAVTEPASNLVNLQRHLFESSQPTPGEPDHTVNIISAAGESRECVEIARTILQLSQNGHRFDRIAVLLRSPDEYRAFLEEAFHRAEVPVHFAQGVVRPDAAGRALVALLRCANERLSARRFAEYLSLGEVPQASSKGTPKPPPAIEERWMTPSSEDSFPPKVLEQENDDTATADELTQLDRSSDYEDPVHGGALRAPRRWEQLLVDAAVIGGRDRWERRLRGLDQQLRLDLETLDDPDDPAADRIRGQIRDLQSLQTFALPVLDDLASLPVSANWGEWIDSLSALASRALRQPQRVLSMLAELAPMSPIGPIELDEVTRVLSRHLLQLRVKPDNRRQGSVFVGPIEASRGHSFDVVFVPGIAERLFPRKISEDSILLDSLRRQLDESLRCNDDRVEAERSSLRLAVGASSKQVVLSYPRVDSEKGRQRVPSFYALEAIRAAEGRLPIFQELADRAKTKDATRVGWPAPADPMLAIDDAEYDLSLLDTLLDKTPAETVGTAHYLLTANPHLARALRFRARRWLKRWTPADGLVDPSERAKAALAAHAMDQRSFSPTALQNFAQCPYKFFLYAILRLAPREEVEAIEEMNPLQRGSLVHEIQFQLLTSLQQHGELPISTDNLTFAMTELDRVVDEVSAKYRDDLAPAIERVWNDGIALVRADLREWLRRTSRDEAGFVPWRFELSFGLPQRRMNDSNSVAEPVQLDCGVQLRGSIDLVERKNPDRIRVTDYKTGRHLVATGSIVEGGSSLQAVLYSLAVEKMFDADVVESGRLYYCTAAGGYEERQVELDDEARQSAAQVVATISDSLSTGFLPAAPADNACRWCDYRTVCGINEERRFKRKPKERTETLVQLRGLK